MIKAFMFGVKMAVVMMDFLSVVFVPEMMTEDEITGQEAESGGDGGGR